MATVNINVKQYENPPLYNAIQLSYNITNDVCNNPKTPYQISNTVLNMLSLIYDTSNVLVVPGWYSDGNNRVNWSGTEVTEILSCVLPPVFFFKFSNPGKTTSALACAETSFSLTLYSISENLEVGTILYTDSSLTTIATTGNLFYKELNSGLPYRIQDGIVQEQGICGPVGYSVIIKLGTRTCISGLSGFNQTGTMTVYLEHPGMMHENDFIYTDSSLTNKLDTGLDLVRPNTVEYGETRVYTVSVGLLSSADGYTIGDGC